MRLEECRKNEYECVSAIFQEFEEVLRPVGTAKVLHLLAPRYFPIWDNKIAKGYGLALNRPGSKTDRYWSFMYIRKQQCLMLREEGECSDNLLKSIDEFNYCRFTKGMSRQEIRKVAKAETMKYGISPKAGGERRGKQRIAN
jgi:hypothetical protein